MENKLLWEAIPKGVKAFSFCGIDVFDLDIDELRDFFAWHLHVMEGFTFEYGNRIQNEEPQTTSSM